MCVHTSTAIHIPRQHRGYTDYVCKHSPDKGRLSLRAYVGDGVAAARVVWGWIPSYISWLRGFLISCNCCCYCRRWNKRTNTGSALPSYFSYFFHASSFSFFPQLLFGDGGREAGRFMTLPLQTHSFVRHRKQESEGWVPTYIMVGAFYFRMCVLSPVQYVDSPLLYSWVFTWGMVVW